MGKSLKNPWVLAKFLKKSICFRNFKIISMYVKKCQKDTFLLSFCVRKSGQKYWNYPFCHILIPHSFSFWKAWVKEFWNWKQIWLEFYGKPVRQQNKTSTTRNYKRDSCFGILKFVYWFLHKNWTKGMVFYINKKHRDYFWILK